MPHRIDRRGQPTRDQLEGVAYQDHVGIVGDEATGRAEMDDRLGVGTLFGVGFHMGHDVVSADPLLFLRDIEVQLLLKPLHLLDLRVCDGESEFLLRLREGNPEPPPRLKSTVGAPEFRHLAGGIPFDERILVGIGG